MAERLESTLEAPSHSRLAKLHECRRAYYYRYVEGLRARGEGTKPAAGRALHAALDSLYRRDNVDDAHRALIASYADHQSAEMPWMTTEHLMAILVHYLHRWPADDDFQPLRLHRSQIESNDAIEAFGGLYDDDGYAIMAESPMIVRLSERLKMTVVLDLLVRRADGRISVVDHKTTCGWLGKSVLNRYLVSHQLPLYIAAARAAFGQCDDAIINAIYMGEQANKPGSRAVKFDRYSFDYTEGQIIESVDWASRTVELARREESEHSRLMLSESAWLQNTSAYCAGCDYLQLCEVGPLMRIGRAAQWYDHADEKEEGDGSEGMDTDA